MELQPPPLTPQEIAAKNYSEYAHTGQPQSVKIFGILHLIVGAYGMLLVLITILGALGINPIMALIPNSATKTAQMEHQAEFQSQVLPFTIITTLMTIAATVFILIAGFYLLKRRRNGLKWSNRYAWTSIALKILGVGFAVFYTLPFMKAATPVVASGSPLAGKMELVMIVSMVFGFVIPFIYPVLTLVLLNRPNVKDWFKNQID